LYGQLSLIENTDVELEHAYGVKNNNGSEDDHATLLGVTGYQRSISYAFKYIHAGPDYPGYYSDMDYLSVGLAAPLGERLRLNTAFRQQKNNLDLDPTLTSAALDRYRQVGLGYKFTTGTHLSLEYRNRNREDRLPSPTFDYKEDTLRFSLSHRFKKFNLTASGESGKTKNELTDQTSILQRYTTSAYFRPTQRQSYSGYLSYDTHSNLAGQKSPRITAGLNSFYRIADRTSLNISVQIEDYLESGNGESSEDSLGSGNEEGSMDYSGSGNEERHNLELGLTHTVRSKIEFFDNNKISVTSWYSSHQYSEKDDEMSFLLTWTIPFGLPVSRKKSIGGIKGHVYDEETKMPVPDAILRVNGATAVTDNEGNFIFPSLRPGTYYLNLERAGVGKNKIPVQKNPMEVTVEPGKEIFIERGITQGATVFGHIMLYRFENDHNNKVVSDKSGHYDASHYVSAEGNSSNGSLNNDEASLVKAYGLANILVKLSNGSDVKRRVTNEKGYFGFEELRPGKWVLKIFDSNLPEYHYLEKNTFEFELGPGEEKEIFANVLPKKRRIHIIEDGGTLLEEEKE